MALKLKIRQGTTFVKPFRWEVEPFIYRPITGIDNSAPCVLHVPGHGLLPDQLFAVQSVLGLTNLNVSSPEVSTDWRRATVIDADTVSLNRIDASRLNVYSAGSGTIKYRTVIDLADYTEARFTIKDKVGGTVLLSLSTILGGVTLDTVGQYINIEIDAATTASFSWKKGVCDLDMVHSSGRVYTPLSAEILIEKE